MKKQFLNETIVIVGIIAPHLIVEDTATAVHSGDRGLHGTLGRMPDGDHGREGRSHI